MSSVWKHLLVTISPLLSRSNVSRCSNAPSLRCTRSMSANWTEFSTAGAMRSYSVSIVSCSRPVFGRGYVPPTCTLGGVGDVACTLTCRVSVLLLVAQVISSRRRLLCTGNDLGGSVDEGFKEEIKWANTKIFQEEQSCVGITTTV